MPVPPEPASVTVPSELPQFSSVELDVKVTAEGAVSVPVVVA